MTEVERRAIGVIATHRADIARIDEAIAICERDQVAAKDRLALIAERRSELGRQKLAARAELRQAMEAAEAVLLALAIGGAA